MPPQDAGLDLSRDGAQLAPSALGAARLAELEKLLADQPRDVAGVRLFGIDGLRPILNADGPVGRLAAEVLGPAARPVRAILFDKSAAANWALAWHQDRVIAVRERIGVDGFGPWSRKHGALHVAPPFPLLARMLTLRVHLDPVPETNAPLLVAPGSTVAAASPGRTCPPSSRPVAWPPAVPARATSGSTPRPSCTPPTAPRLSAAAGCCRWTTRPTLCREGWTGWGSEGGHWEIKLKSGKRALGTTYTLPRHSRRAD